MVSAKDVVQAQAHIGTLKSEAHPKTNKYWAEITKGVVVIDPESIANQIKSAKEKIQKAKSEGKTILLVCEKKMYMDELAKLGEKYNVSYINSKVPAGFLTNFETLKKRIESMNSMARFLETEAFKTLTKKEQLVYRRKLARVYKTYGGVKNLTNLPDLIVLVDAQMMTGFLNELEKKKNIDSIIIAGTNFSKRWKEDGIIVCNILSHKTLDFVFQNIMS